MRPLRTQSGGGKVSPLSPPLGLRPVLQNCRIYDLQIDHSYQRAIDNAPSQRLIRQIARGWDWRLFQPLVVAQRAEGELFVVDGQHRLAAARSRGDLYDLPCVIQPYAGPAEEAAAFVELNQRRKPLGAIELFRGAIAGADEGAMAVMRLLSEAGLSLAPHHQCTSWKPGMVSNIAGIQRCHRIHGEAVTARALSALAQAFEGQVLRYGGTLFAGIYPVIVELGARCDDALLIRVLAGASQGEWIQDMAAVETARGIHRSKAAAIAIRAAYDEALAEALEDQAA